MSVYIKNETGFDGIFRGLPIQNLQWLFLPTNLMYSWGNDVSIAELIISNELKVSLTGIDSLAPLDGIKVLQGLRNESAIVDSATFTSKRIGPKRLFTRVTGISYAVVVGNNVLNYVIPYEEMKFNGLEISNGKSGESVNLKVLDSSTGLISGVPGFMLNQFGFNVNVPDGYYSRSSTYDSDLYGGLVIRIEYTAIEARNVGVNYFLHELKV